MQKYKISKFFITQSLNVYKLKIKKLHKCSRTKKGFSPIITFIELELKLSYYNLVNKVIRPQKRHHGNCPNFV